MTILQVERALVGRPVLFPFRQERGGAVSPGLGSTSQLDSVSDASSGSILGSSMTSLDSSKGHYPSGVVSLAYHRGFCSLTWCVLCHGSHHHIPLPLGDLPENDGDGLARTSCVQPIVQVGEGILNLLQIGHAFLGLVLPFLSRTLI